MSWLLDAFELFMLNVSCNSHCFLALCCALHRITSRVIHRTELYLFFCIIIIYIYNDKQQWFVEWKGLKQDDIYIISSCYLHNGATQSYIYMNVRSLKFLFMIELKYQSKTVMIHTQVHLRIPCYDFYFL
jgi:hypothetical protein